MNIAIREESAADEVAIHALLVAALGPAEAELVDDLRRNGDLVLSLVAFERTSIVGHVGVSRLVLKDGHAGALAPLAVAADCRRSGIGGRLVTEALARRRVAGDDVVLVLGDPAYYGRFGFSVEKAKPFRTPWDGPCLQALWLSAAARLLANEVRYPDAFSRLS